MTSAALHIFRPGRHTAMSGATLAFSESDLQATVAAYDPARHEAPLVVGHPRHDLPAYGWVQSLRYSDGDEGQGLYATPAQVNPDFADMVAAGAFKKISAAFYAPDAPNNPVPGVYYLRHVGFLGAQPPAVKGLRAPEFADEEAGVVTLEFSEWDDVTNASLWRRMREWFIGKFGQEEADRVLPTYDIQQLEQGAQDEVREAQAEAQSDAASASASTSPSFSQPESTVTEEEAARIRAENTRLADELAHIKTAQAHDANVAFCDALIADGRLLPAARDVIVATLDHLAGQGQPVEFGEGAARAPLIDSLKATLKAAPKAVEFGEQATGDRAAQGGETGHAGGDDAAFAESADPARLAQHQAIKAHMAQHQVDYATAARAVIK